MIAVLKGVHLAAMFVWCAGLIALPVLILTGADRWRGLKSEVEAQARYSQFRQVTHYGYVAVTSPAAILAIAAGTALSFAAGIFDLWFIAKLMLVIGMVCCHVWIGHVILRSGETRGARVQRVGLALALAIPLMAGVIALVLIKPDLMEAARFFPSFMRQPWGGWK